MVSIRKALSSDFEEIYLLFLKTYKNTSIPKDDWRKGTVWAIDEFKL